MAQASALVVGSGGRLGTALVRALRDAGEECIATRRRGPLAPGELALDLEAPGLELERFDPPAGIDRAFLCAAVTSEAACRAEPALSRRVNVAATAALARALVSRGIFVVLPSTDRVFDGSRPRRRPGDPPRPLGAYGAQKAEAERRVLTLGAGVAVVRLGKLVDAGLPLFQGWRRALRSGRPIAPFSDLRFSPVPLARAAEALLAVARARRAGVFQLSAEGDLSYADAARELARRLGAPAALVRPVRAGPAGPGLPAPARHATLECGRLREELGLRPPTLGEGLDALLGARDPRRR
jgi:dTDP-4-dehydrorhamnose reductase